MPLSVSNSLQSELISQRKAARIGDGVISAPATLAAETVSMKKARMKTHPYFGDSLERTIPEWPGLGGSCVCMCTTMCVVVLEPLYTPCLAVVVPPSQLFIGGTETLHLE
jgi:hypothetical protein